ncbi:HupE/UreJ family protein [Shewanella corallii]|uniref:HupE/UreJ family protein n=1 Tax=Shewanella corallii TaxID=560080 RepID=A0ABT0NAY4_9GAMM|nr:HupE/UreJ family protein [Shewanella corallii]MCL2915525.1 HupE/UreJ family protein [Shewanella corallii]
MRSALFLWLLLLSHSVYSHGNLPVIVGVSEDANGVVLTIPQGEIFRLNHTLCLGAKEDKPAFALVDLNYRCRHGRLNEIWLRLTREQAHRGPALRYSDEGVQTLKVDGDYRVQLLSHASPSYINLIVAGASHLLFGWDHLLILLLLVLERQPLKDTASSACAFAMGHFVAILWITFLAPQLNARGVEALIASSILVYARTLLKKGAEPIPIMFKSGLWLMLGLIHGAGLSAGLAVAGDWPAKFGSVLLFNLGIDLTQLVVLTTAWWLVSHIRESRSFSAFSGALIFTAGLLGVGRLMMLLGPTSGLTG